MPSVVVGVLVDVVVPTLELDEIDDRVRPPVDELPPKTIVATTIVTTTARATAPSTTLVRRLSRCTGGTLPEIGGGFELLG
jgi:hypothetical protein